MADDINGFIGFHDGRYLKIAEVGSAARGPILSAFSLQTTGKRSWVRHVWMIRILGPSPPAMWPWRWRWRSAATPFARNRPASKSWVLDWRYTWLDLENPVKSCDVQRNSISNEIVSYRNVRSVDVIRHRRIQSHPVVIICIANIKKRRNLPYENDRYLLEIYLLDLIVNMLRPNWPSIYLIKTMKTWWYL